MAASSSTSPLYNRLLSELKPLHDRLFDDVFKYGSPTTVERRSRSQAFHPRAAAYFGALNIDFYIVKTRSQPDTDRMFSEDSLVSEELKRAAMTYNRCKEGAVALSPALEKMFGGDLEVESVKQFNVDVKPLLHLFLEHEVGHEKIVTHDIFVIRAKNGSSFVFDPTGYQFGFNNYLWTYDEYKSRFVNGKPRPVCPEEEARTRSSAAWAK
ncbi:hypothetical protein DM02DRAFT_650515 [Periconia macrospinosa]|uniref:Uncharacterized protein n=1 Tax=Periconia macrospinosa TaxID=97972 RepID=A0A2V1E4U9_9PLEO|nr:hypothetical protein DM02DRAFT_650515 [Periconia macrospinosa]